MHLNVSVRSFSHFCLLIFLIFNFTQIINAQNLPSSKQIDLDNYQKLAEENKTKGNKSEQAKYLNKIAFLFWGEKMYNQAIDNFIQSIAVNQEIGNSNAIMTIYSNIGMIYNDMGQQQNALNYFIKSLEIKRKQGSKDEIASQLINIANLLADQNKLNESIKYAEEALKYSIETNNLKLVRSCYGRLYDSYQKAGNSQKSFEYFNLYSSFDKKIKEEQVKEIKNMANNAVADKVATEKQLVTQFEKLKLTKDTLNNAEKVSHEKQLEIEMLKRDQEIKEHLLQEEKILKQNALLFRNSLIGGILLLFLLAIAILIGFKSKQKANKLLTQQNLEIQKQSAEIQKQNDAIRKQQILIEETGSELEKVLDTIYVQNIKIDDSIKYAVHIQEAILPDPNELYKFLPDSFILLKPLDKVSGDFYWFTDSEKTNLLGGNFKDKFIIAAVDCTGHGVPGAFMSIIGANILNDIVNMGIFEPDLILKELHKSIKRVLKQDFTDAKEGMDISMCLIDFTNKEIHYSGAYQPLVYIENGEINVIKGDVLTIGGNFHKEKENFTKHIIKPNSQATFYLFSDGFVDQFGGDNKRKFMPSRLYNLLTEIHLKSFDEQKNILNKTIEDWKGTNIQTDDILVIGFKIG